MKREKQIAKILLKHTVEIIFMAIFAWNAVNLNR